MNIEELPPNILSLLREQHASMRLVAHLTLVYTVARELVSAIAEHWTCVQFDQHATIIGAAIHDIGKILYPQELSAPGNRHEDIPSERLLEWGIPAQVIRFVHSHAHWEAETATIEDLLVALADTVWKGKRNSPLETKIAEYIAHACKVPVWNVYMSLDDVLTEITKHADARLKWQQQHAISTRL